MDSLFSIGHGNKTIEEFLNELKSFDIAYLVDTIEIYFIHLYC